MGISIEDGIRSVTCDNKDCELEIRGDAINLRSGIYHERCVPQQ